jgi:hypothetical protein
MCYMVAIPANILASVPVVKYSRTVVIMIECGSMMEVRLVRVSIKQLNPSKEGAAHACAR